MRCRRSMSASEDRSVSATSPSSGAARASSMRVRRPVIGVRSSCEASEMNARRWAAAPSSRPSRWLTWPASRSASSPVAGTPTRSPRSASSRSCSSRQSRAYRFEQPAGQAGHAPAGEARGDRGQHRHDRREDSGAADVGQQGQRHGRQGHHGHQQGAECGDRERHARPYGAGPVRPEAPETDVPGRHVSFVRNCRPTDGKDPGP
ncbi:hypothetical protein LUX33_42710 [Actinomadura madurae]|uniref:hypothetical protein n=1 Tax=Actinomadura madurae TaxID=1993 RepID=UPI0020D25BFF|nr:hypothetical protein [Actinomadura madurae]MCP9954452.1 hypothetical protein [Actinomadura madurae]